MRYIFLWICIYWQNKPVSSAYMASISIGKRYTPVLHVWNMCNRGIYPTHILNMYLHTCICVKHMYYMCKTYVMQVYILHLYYMFRIYTCITCVKHMYYSVHHDVTMCITTCTMMSQYASPAKLWCHNVHHHLHHNVPICITICIMTSQWCHYHSTVWYFLNTFLISQSSLHILWHQIWLV
jgi:hypothetical protein